MTGFPLYLALLLLANFAYLLFVLRRPSQRVARGIPVPARMHTANDRRALRGRA